MRHATQTGAAQRLPGKAGFPMALLLLIGLGLESQARGETRPALPELRVSLLRDAGGLGKPSAGEPTLNTRLSRALETHLAEIAKGRYVTIPRGKKPSASQASGRLLTVEGELSHVDTGEANGGPYLCVLRLFQEGKTRRLIGQWAGYARSFRDVSSNLHNDPRISPYGLVGELSRRIGEAASHTGDTGQSARLAALVQQAMDNSKRLSIKVVPQSGPRKSASVGGELAAGDRYRLSVTSQEAGSLYLIGLEKPGKPVMLLEPCDETTRVLTPAHSLTAPELSEPPLTVGNLRAGEEQELVVLVRRLHRATRETANRQPESRVRLASASPDVAEASPQEQRAVVIVEGGVFGGSASGPGDVGVERILKMAASDPAGTWIAQRIRLRITAPVPAFWESTGRGRKDPKMLKLVPTPNKRTVEVMEKFGFQVQSGAEGYLILISRNSAGTVELLSPPDGNLDFARMEAGGKVSLPLDTDTAYASDRVGKEQARALLFHTREEAEIVLNILRRGPGGEAEPFPKSFLIAETTLEVVPVAKGKSKSER